MWWVDRVFVNVRDDLVAAKFKSHGYAGFTTEGTSQSLNIECLCFFQIFYRECEMKNSMGHEKIF